MEYAFTLFDEDVPNGEDTSYALSALADVELGQYVKVTVTADGTEHEYLSKITTFEEAPEQPPYAVLDDSDGRVLTVGLYADGGNEYVSEYLNDRQNTRVDFASAGSTIHVKADIYNSTGISYDTPGEYELIYSATDSCGNTATVSRMVTVESGSEYPYTLCTIGAYQGSNIGEGDNFTISNVTWVTEPPADGKVRVLTIYGENCEVDGNAMENPIGNGRAYGNDAIHLSIEGGFGLTDPVPYGENPLQFQNEGSYVSSLSWDSIRVEVTGEEEGA